MRIVGIGDLVLDCYYDHGNIIAVDGGITVHNIIANLSNMGIDTCVIGACGDDIEGKIAIDSLKNLQVDTSYVNIVSQLSTRKIHINLTEDGFTSKRKCPKCQSKTWYDEEQTTINNIKKYLKEDDIIVLAGLNKFSQNILNHFNNKVLIDIGYYNEMDNYSDKDIVNFFKRKFEIINLNERVDYYIKNRFPNQNIYNTNLLIITHGKDGADFIYKGNKYNMSLTPSDEKDPNGAGDAFFASIIFDYLTDKNFDLDKSFKNATNLTSKVVSCLGARGHLHNLFEVEKENDSCACKSLILKRNRNN